MRISKPFFISAHEVRLDQYRLFLKETKHKYSPPTPSPSGLDEAAADLCPIFWVSWFDAVAFCNWLSRKEGRNPCYVIDDKMPGKDGHEAWVCDFRANGYRLPTEAEWEYSCRAGTATRFSFGDNGDDLTRYGFFIANSNHRAWPVGMLLPNPWGLFDMYGNVAEWCHDWEGPYGEVVQDPVGPATGKKRIYRGGTSVAFRPHECESAYRDSREPADSSVRLGVRLVCASQQD